MLSQVIAKNVGDVFFEKQCITNKTKAEEFNFTTRRHLTESMRMDASGVARSLRYRVKSMRSVYVTPRSRHELGLTMK